MTAKSFWCDVNACCMLLYKAFIQGVNSGGVTVLLGINDTNSCLQLKMKYSIEFWHGVFSFKLHALLNVLLDSAMTLACFCMVSSCRCFSNCLWEMPSMNISK